MKISSTQTINLICLCIALSSCMNTSGLKHEIPNTMAQQFETDKDGLRQRLQAVVDAQIGRGNVHEIALSISTGNDDSAVHLSGELTDDDVANSTDAINSDTPYFTASTSKLFATTIVLQLVDEGKLSLDDFIIKFFPENALNGLHVLKGVDRTKSITVRHLLAHTSGVADYFEGKLPDGSRFFETLLNNQDSTRSVTEVIDTVKDNLTPQFVPGKPNKASYSDTNFQLIGAIIENVTQASLSENVSNRITTPLQLKDTYLFTQETIQTRLPVLPLRIKERTLDIPMAMESVRLDGGIVSTSAESLIFLQAFMQGKLFDSTHIAEIQQWNSIGFPLQAGVGILKFRLPRLLTMFTTPQVLVGHSGVSGAFAFYSPTSNIYLAGTLNQLENQTLPFRFMLKVINAAKTK